MSTIIKRATFALPLVMIGWIVVMAIVMRVSDVAPAAVVLFPGRTIMENLPDDTAILGLSSLALTVANRPGITGELYQSGAWLVLPAGLTGCLPLTKAKRDKLPR